MCEFQLKTGPNPYCNNVPTCFPWPRPLQQLLDSEQVLGLHRLEQFLVLPHLPGPGLYPQHPPLPAKLQPSRNRGVDVFNPASAPRFLPTALAYGERRTDEETGEGCSSADKREG